MTAAEICGLHAVSERTAYRWLRDGDPRAYAGVTDTAPPPSTRIVPMPFDEEFVMRARNFERALAGLHCFLHAHADKGYPEAIKLRDAFKRAVDSGGLDEFYEVAGFNQIDPVQ